MTDSPAGNVQPRTAKWGWGILLALSALLVFHGATWFRVGPDTALENIAERTTLGEDDFQVGFPSAFHIITLINRNSSVYEIAFGLFAGIAAWQGFRHGSRAAWKQTWILVIALGAVAANFIVPGRGISGPGASYLAVAAIALASQLLARPR